MVALPINRPVQIETKKAHIDLQYKNIVSDRYGWTWWRWLRNITNIADAVIKEIGITDLQSGWIKRQAAWVSVLSRSIKLSSVTRYSNFPVNKKKWGTHQSKSNILWALSKFQRTAEHISHFNYKEYVFISYWSALNFEIQGNNKNFHSMLEKMKIK